MFFLPKAAHYFNTDNKKSNAAQIQQKLALLMTTHGDKFLEAAIIFESSGYH